MKEETAQPRGSGVRSEYVFSEINQNLGLLFLALFQQTVDYHKTGETVNNLPLAVLPDKSEFMSTKSKLLLNHRIQYTHIQGFEY